MFVHICDVCGMEEKPAETAKEKKVRSYSLYPSETCYVTWRQDLCGECFDMIVRQLKALCTERQAS